MNEYKISYADLTSPMGDMIAGATENGICFLEWQDRGGVQRILKRVTKRYKCEPVKESNLFLTQLQIELNEYFDSSRSAFDVPIDVTGTKFEQQVWQALGKIPHGRTLSYGKLAESVGKPGGARAAGRANGANYLAILIPCHRVIESTGGLGGYGGKVWRKKRLLELESGVTEAISLTFEPTATN